MPEESINIFISNIYAIAIFTGFFVAIFLVLFFISRILIQKTKRIETGSKDLSSHEGQNQQQSGKSGSVIIIRKDIYILKNLFISGILFIFVIFFIILMLLSYLFATDFRMEGSLYIIFALIFLIIAITIYIVKSKIIER